ncbi:specificity determinant HsdS [Thalassobacillus devorans]|uniref:Specificity determinant HsdS n=1 Tax=Thalassobacillus devorans TaxID=279813 RepID=A0ABQ1P3A2_9BACI|nr:restriction endonuclease subunit S [Thalassobacillus devorans]NIK28203.1 type I restriction enzyme S subunit [Thalassobacillus devorans]GGC88087.1 specificity determinant HsdS [Thalassobacillus devorans]
MTRPVLGFKGFKNGWRKDILINRFKLIDGDRGSNYPNENDFQKEGYCLFLNAHNLTETGFDFSNMNFISEEKHNSLRKGQLEFEDIIITSRGSKLGKVAIYNKTLPSNVIRINSAMLIIRKKTDAIMVDFMEKLIRYKILPRFIYSSKIGSAQPHVTVRDLNKETFSFPNDIEEQKKIADFFSLLDRRIEKQQEKIALLKERKKGLLHKIFSQELRFKDDNGKDFPKWKQVKIGSILKVRHGKDQKQVQIDEGKYPILGTGGVIGYTNTPLYTSPSVLIGRKGTINKPQFREQPFWTVDTLFYTEILLEHRPKFVYYLFQTINWLKYNEASGVPSLSASTIESITCLIPSVKEQNKIADFFSLFDNKIQIENQKLVNLHEQKKGFMQKMFI